MANIVNVKKLNEIRDNYPVAWKWMQHKATSEHMCMGAVLNNYEEYIDEIINKEKWRKNREDILQMFANEKIARRCFD